LTTPKVLQIKSKHGVDFEEAQVMWNDPEAATHQVTDIPDEARYVRVVMYQEKLWRIV
jgi:uncharacterized DUF497 family protein